MIVVLKTRTKAVSITCCSMQGLDEAEQQERKEVYEKIVEAFSQKYSWLGAQAAREMLISVATWNIQKYSNPPFRYRTHVMLAWERGYLKSTMMRAMADILGDEMVSVIGKVSEAAMRGSVSGGSFTPPKPLRTPIVISTEFGQTSFQDELLNLFLNQLEEGKTNVALNKVGSLSENKKRDIEKKYDNNVKFKANNEFNLYSDFVFWGATYDPSKLADDALRSRFNVVTPSKPLNHEITQCADNSPSVNKLLDKETIRACRRAVKSEKEHPTDFRPPDRLYKKYNLIPRESRDIQSYMAGRNWWGLECNPEVMEKYIKYLQESRRVSTMSPEERVFDLVFDTPKTYDEIKEETGLRKKQIYKIMQSIGAERYDLGGDDTRWVIYSGEGSQDPEDDNDGDDEDSESIFSDML